MMREEDFPPNEIKKKVYVYYYEYNTTKPIYTISRRYKIIYPIKIGGKFQ